MKLIHLSDLHIGKRVNEFSMAEDQKYILNQILEIIDREQPDCVVIAGDVYDKSIPSAEAVQILDDFLTRLAGRKIPAAMISGNHDSPERLSFGAQLMKESGIYVSPVYDGQVQSIGFADEYGEVRVYLLPFLKPATVRHVYEEETVESYQDAVETAISHLPLDTSCRNVLVAHQFAAGASRCESEEMSVGGIDQVDVSVFDDFDYVALGHIHSPQSAGRPAVRYCGTPLKYSFSEAGQQKSVSVVELFEKGRVEIREVPLTPLRDMRKIRGTYLELTARSFYQGTNREDYLHVILTDEEDVPEAMGKLRTIYPNLMKLSYDNRRTQGVAEVTGAERPEEKTPLELFQDFYQLQNNQPMAPQQEALVRQLMETIWEGTQ